jgi:membrane protein YfhO
MTASRPRGWFWPLFATVAAIVPVAGVFTLTKVFFVRDLTLAFRSRFLFVRQSLFSGAFPLWDPYPASGQSAVNDALYQLFHLPTIAIRLLLPALVAFNVWVALPVPLAALGMYLFLRGRLSRPAASLGAIAFGVAGPIVSSTNFPNVSWCLAAVPYVFWTIDRLAARPSAVNASWLALAVSLQALAGEPVTLAATLMVATAYIVLEAWDAGELRRGSSFPPRRCVYAAIALLAGVLLASIQFVPLAVASSHSVRAVVPADDFWSFHPLALSELLIPHFFGDYFNSRLRELAWMVALNSAREPFYYTMYIGAPVWVLAVVAAVSGRPRARFWTVVFVVCVLASLGAHTPFYPALQALLPPLRAFRFSVKYLAIASFALAVLAAMTIQWLLDNDVPRAAVRRTIVLTCSLAALTYSFIAWLLVAPRLPISAFYELAIWAGVPFPSQGAQYLIFRARPLLTALLLKLLCTAFLLWVAASTRRERQKALAVLAAFLVIDLLASNSSVNPTIEEAWLARPSWVQLVPPGMHERLYVGGRLEGYVESRDVDAPKYVAYLEGFSDLDQRYIVVNELEFHTSGLNLREAVSYDLPLLWPADYARMIGRFKIATREERLRFLSRTGVRYCVLPTPPFPGARSLATLVGLEQLKLYECFPGARRVSVVPDALMGPDAQWQIEGLFLERFNPATGVLVSEQPPPPAGAAGPSAQPDAVFEEDSINRVAVRASLPEDGYLVLMDSYDAGWQVNVDGAPAPLMRANGLYRAVHLRRGQHLVTFTYRPRTFLLGATMTGSTAFALVLWCGVEARRRRRLVTPHEAAATTP